MKTKAIVEDKLKNNLPKIGFLFLLYFIQGLPFGLQEKFLPVYFRSKGYDYTNIFLFRLVHVPWLCKMLWAPFVDYIENKRACVSATLFMLTICYLCASLVNIENGFLIASAMILVNFVVSFQDVALDTLALTSLSTSELGQGNTAQIVGYKIGMTVGSGGFAFMTYYWGLRSVFLLMAVVQLWALTGFFWTRAFETRKTEKRRESPALPNENFRPISPSPGDSRRRLANMSRLTKPSPKRIPSSKDAELSSNQAQIEKIFSSFYLNYINILRQKGTAWLIFFVITYKLGETGVLSMFPLFLIDAGVSEDVVFLWNGIIAQAASILGSVVGGKLSTNKKTLHRNLSSCHLIRFVFILFVTLIVLDANEPLREPEYSVKLLCAVICLSVLSFTSGLVTTMTFTLMMMSTKKVPKNYQASYYSVLSTMEVAGKLAFVISLGPLVDQYGEKTSFLTCCVISLAQLPILWFYPSNLR